MAFTATYSDENLAFPSTAKIFQAAAGGTVFNAVAYNAAVFDYFGDAAVANDALYFTSGTTSVGLPSGLKFNIGTPMAGTDIVLIWEYYKWTGVYGSVSKGWAPIEDVSDDTNGFTTTGSNSVKFPNQWQPSAVTVNGQTGYFVRCRIVSLTTITEGGANITDAVKYGRGELTISGTSDAVPGTMTEIYDWLVANKPYISVSKTADRVFDFTKVGLIINSRVLTTDETILLGQNNVFENNYTISGRNQLYYLTSGYLHANGRGYGGSTLVVYGTLNSVALAFATNTKFYGSTIRTGKYAGDAGLYPGYTTIAGTFVDCHLEISISTSSSLTTFLRTKIVGPYFICGANWNLDANDFTYICTNAFMFYQYRDSTGSGWTITGFDYDFVTSDGKGVLVYFYTYHDRLAAVFTFINIKKSLGSNTSDVRPCAISFSGATSFTSVKKYTESTGAFTDLTAAASSATTGDVPLYGAVGDILYFGNSAAAWSMNFYLEMTSQINDYTYVWEYYTTNNTWEALEPYVWDATNNLSQTGHFLSSVKNPNIKATTIDGQNYYWIRARITAVGTGTPTADRIRYRAMYGIGPWQVVSKYTVDVTVTTEDGTPIDGASVSAVYEDDSAVFDTTTDVDGTITTQYFVHKLFELDPTDTTYFIGETEHTEMVVTIEKSGYDTVILPVSNVLSAQNLIISMKQQTGRESFYVDQEQI